MKKYKRDENPTWWMSFLGEEDETRGGCLASSAGASGFHLVSFSTRPLLHAHVKRQRVVLVLLKPRTALSLSVMPPIDGANITAHQIFGENFRKMRINSRDG